MSRFVKVEKWDCTEAEYFDGEAVGSSSICRALGKAGPSPQTGDLGNAIDHAVLRPHLFDALVRVPPPECQRGSGTGQQTRLKEWRAQQPEGAIILSPSDYETALAVAKSAENRRTLSWFQGQPDVEIQQSWRAVDQETGLTIRLRPDVLRGRVIGDLKMSKSPDLPGFKRSVYSLLYFVQAALYYDVLGAEEFWWLVVGNKGEHRVALYRCTDDLLELGRRAYSAGLDLIAHARFEKREHIPAWWEDRPLPLHDLESNEEPPVWLVKEIIEYEDHAQRVSRLRGVG